MSPIGYTYRTGNVKCNVYKQSWHIPVRRTIVRCVRSLRTLYTFCTLVPISVTKKKKNLNSPPSKAVQLLLNGNIKAFSFSPSYIQVTQTTLYGVDTGVACRV